jgi:hypothetical protein
MFICSFSWERVKKMNYCFPRRHLLCELIDSRFVLHLKRCVDSHCKRREVPPTVAWLSLEYRNSNNNSYKNYVISGLQWCNIHMGFFSQTDTTPPPPPPTQPPACSYFSRLSAVSVSPSLSVDHYFSVVPYPLTFNCSTSGIFVLWNESPPPPQIIQSNGMPELKQTREHLIGNFKSCVRLARNMSHR